MRQGGKAHTLTHSPPPTTTPIPQAEDMKDKVLRTLADMENLRERTARTAAETKQYAVQVRGAGAHALQAAARCTHSCALAARA